jgi:bifunctional non-homologous end joining protein LigD
MPDPQFVVQEHHALRAGLHYDFRLEHDGVLKSWACRKIPPTEVQDDTGKRIKRLCLPVNDHPLHYGKFQGTIPEGYGAGDVTIWDHGNYDVQSWSHNHIVMELHGKQLHGKYEMVCPPHFRGCLLYKVDPNAPHKIEASTKGMSDFS